MDQSINDMEDDECMENDNLENGCNNDSDLMDSDCPSSNVEEQSQRSSTNQTLSLTSFLFGNIDACGQLEGDVFDPECKRQLASLSRLGLGSLLRQVTDDGEDEDDDEEDEEDDLEEEEEALVKSPSAVDYSDINELVEDDSLIHPEDDGEDYDDFDAKVKHEDFSHASNDDGDDEKKSDSELMPPPPPPMDTAVSQAGTCDGMKPNTPLAAMLPVKYANVDVKELFPDFRQESVLRFSRLFGAGKQSHLPKIWKHVKKRKRKRFVDKGHSIRGHDGTDRFVIDGEESCVDSEQSYAFYSHFQQTGGFEIIYGPEPEPVQCVADDEVVFSRPPDEDAGPGSHKGEGERSRSSKNGPREADWRFGPAQLWYDMLDVSSMGDGFDYGFKLIPKRDDETEMDNDTEEAKKEEVDTFPLSIMAAGNGDEFSDDAFHMITQYNWEEDIIWNGDDSKHKLNQKRKNMAAGWVPSSYNRTAQAFSQPGKSSIPFTTTKNSKNKNYSQSNASSNTGNSGGGTTTNGGNACDGDDTWYSIFPVENEELIYDRWEDDIIWDPDSMDHVPEPKVLTLDPNDENIILGIPEDVDPSTLTQGNEAPVKVKIPHPHVKKSKILLGKAGVITTIEEESPPPPPKSPDKDPFNLSNDEYYQAKSTEQTIKMALGGGLLQHSTPVVELQPPFVPTFMGEKKLRLFHRPPLKHFSHGTLAQPGPHSVHPLVKEIRRKAKQREQERLASGGGDVFFMRTPEDLTGKDGDIIVSEFCEEFPPILSQVGMCTRIKNYYKRRIGNDKGPPEYRYGETAYAHTSPFLGSMHPGQSIQTTENNMYRAPLYEHSVPPSDFLVIRTRSGYSIREVDALFCCGQQCPLYEVPGPNSKRANNFIRDFLQVFIYRLFWQSRDAPRRIKMDEIKRAYPAHSESSIRKRLKPCADFKRTGVDSNWWVIKPEFRLPTEDEIRAMVSPEQCCAFFSMLAAEQRLKDAGYGDKFLSALEDDNDDDTQKLDDEIKVAPWHTTRAYIQAVKGKCLLQLTGPADPTGCGEGFSYIRIPNKPTQNKEEQDQQPKRTVTGTDADLRKLSLNDAKNLLRNYGVPEEEIKKLTRWEVIDVVRTLSTEKAKAGEEGMNKFSRGNRFSIAEHQERYKEECQRIFDLQNRVLASEEVLSTDEGSSEEEENDSDMEEKGKYIENILANKKTSSQMTLEKEEQERKELQKMIMGEDDKEDRKKNPKKDDDENSQYGYGTAGRLLRITRTFRSADGKEYTRVETVRKTAVIDTYVKIRKTKDEAFIRNFAGQLDETQKEEIKRERRRLQEQLRRIKRNQERLQKGIITPPKTKKPKLKPDLKLKCGACGQVGHMRTNKACPMYATTPGPMPQPAMIQMSEDQEEQMVKSGGGGGGVSSSGGSATIGGVGGGIDESDELVNVDGTKIKLSSKVMKHAEELKRRSFMMKGPKDQGGRGGSRRRRAGTVVHCDYLKRKNKSVNRRRIDPVITLSTIFEEMLNEMREMADVQPFLFPVNAKQVPDYYNVVQHPMDLSTIRDNLRQKKYQSREEFLSDINQIVENSKLYNGVNSTLTAASERMLSLCIDRFAEKEERLMRLEKAINPLLDDDDQVAFDYILDNIVNTKLFTMQESWPFMKPVNKKNVKDYYEIIQQPMDLQTVAKKVKNHKYHSRSDFMHDIELILTNSDKYNGSDSAFTQKAKTLVQFCKDSLAEYGDHLEGLEKKISLAQARAMEQAEVDSLGDSGGPDEEGNYTYTEPDSQSQADQMASPTEHDMDYYGDDEEQVNVDVEGQEEGEIEDVKPQVKGISGKATQAKPRKKKSRPKKSPGGPTVPKKQRPSQDQHRNLLEDDLEFTDEEEEKEKMTRRIQEEMESMVASSNVSFPPDMVMRESHHAQEIIHFSDEYDRTYQSVEGCSEGGNVVEMRGLDENYDPSAAFLGGIMERRDDSTINHDLEVSDSEDDQGHGGGIPPSHPLQHPDPEEEDGGSLWF